MSIRLQLAGAFSRRGVRALAERRGRVPLPDVARAQQVAAGGCAQEPDFGCLDPQSGLLAGFRQLLDLAG